MASTKTRRRLDPRRVLRCVTCKIDYATEAEAADAAERAMLLGLVMPGCHLVAYSCDQCGRFHVCNKVIVQLGAHPRTTFQQQGADDAHD